MEIQPIVIKRLKSMTQQAIKRYGGQQQLAEAIGTSQGTVSRWLRGEIEKWPEAQHLIAFAEANAMTPGYLINRLVYGNKEKFTLPIKKPDDIENAIRALPKISEPDRIKLIKTLVSTQAK